MKNRLFGFMVCLALAILFVVVTTFFASRANQVRAQVDTTLEYTLTGNQFLPFDGSEPWIITGGCMTWELFDVFNGEFPLAVYAVRGVSIEVVEPSGTVHTLTVVPDGLPSPFFYDPALPEDVQDSGIVNISSTEFFLDMIFYDLSIDGQPVDQQDIIGGPALVGSFWTGTFPEPTSFFVDMDAFLESLGLFAEIFLAGELLPCAEPVAATVTIKPESLNLESKGVLTAFITLPEEFSVADIILDTIECNGASALRGVFDGDTLLVKFNRQDLVDVEPDDVVTLTVKGELVDGTSFAGSDTVRVTARGS